VCNMSRQEVDLVISAVGSLALDRCCLKSAAQDGRGLVLALEVVGHNAQCLEGRQCARDFYLR